MKHIAIVGGGPCGLVALKEMLAKGHDATLLEKAECLGGTFATAAAYPDLHLTISNWAMAFSDYPDPERLCYPSGAHYLEYLKAYANHFGLEDHIRYRSEVHSARIRPDGQWVLEVAHNGDDELLRMSFDALIVATGANQVPNSLPPTLSGFQGRVIHSSEYNAAIKEEVAEKQLQVLVVGGGESAADISSELAGMSDNVTVWLRRAACMGPRYLNSKREMEQVGANKLQDFPANGFLEAATTNRMSSSLNVYAYGAFRRVLWHTSVLNRTLNWTDLESTADAFLMNDQATYVTKNQRMCEAIEDGELELLICPEVSTEGTAVNFYLSNGTVQSREFDIVVVCTGFTTRFPWLKIENLDANPRSWFLHCFPEGLGRSLAFVGYARPHQGGIPVMAEMLSRYIAVLHAGERQLPQDYPEQARYHAAAERAYYHISPHLNTLVDYNAFLESIARRIGCEPRLPMAAVLTLNLQIVAMSLVMLSCITPGCSLLEIHYAVLLWACSMVLMLVVNNGILFKWWFYPGWSTWYRQRGPGAAPQLLDKVLRRVPVWSSTDMTRGFIFILLWSFPAFYIQRVLSMVLFPLQLGIRLCGRRVLKRWGAFLQPKLFALHGTQRRISDLFLA